MSRSRENPSKTQSRTQLLYEHSDSSAVLHQSHSSSIKAVSKINEIEKLEQLREHRQKATKTLIEKVNNDLSIMTKSIDVYDKIKTSITSEKSLQERLDTKPDEFDALRDTWHQFTHSAKNIESLIQNLRVIQDIWSTRLREADKPFEWAGILGQLNLEETKETNEFNFATFQDEKGSPVVFQVAKKSFAEGGFGQIFKARKIAADDKIQVENYVCKFVEEKDFYLKESALIQTFGMSHLPPTHLTTSDQGIIKHWVAIFMKDLGQSLSHDLETIRGLDGLEKVELLKKLAHRVCLLHEMYVIHCDIKLNNFVIFLSPDKKKVLDVFLIDFGAAKYTSSKNSLVPSTLYVINQGAPESVIEEKRELSSDVFSLGIVFIDILKKPGSDSVLKDKRDHHKTMDDDLKKQKFEEKIQPLKNEFKKMIEELDSNNLDESKKILQDILARLTMNLEWSHFVDKRKIICLKTLYDRLCQFIQEKNEVSAKQTQGTMFALIDSRLMTTFYRQRCAEIAISLNFDGLCENDPILMELKPVVSPFLSRMTFHDHTKRPSSEEVRDFFDALGVYYKSTDTETKDLAKLKFSLMAKSCWNVKIGKKSVFDNKMILKLFNEFEKYRGTIQSFYEKLKLIDLDKTHWDDADHVRFLISIEKDFTKVLKAFLFLRNGIGHAEPESKHIDLLLKDWEFSSENNKARLDTLIQLEKTGQLNPVRVLDCFKLHIDTSKKIESKSDRSENPDEKVILVRKKTTPLKNTSAILKLLHQAGSSARVLSSAPSLASPTQQSPQTVNRVFSKMSSKLSSLLKLKNKLAKEKSAKEPLTVSAELGRLRS